MIRSLITLFSLLITLAFNLLAQQDDYQLGLNPNYLRQTQGAYFDYSDPEGLNIKVSVWGYVKYPGRYVIPQYSDIKDLISYAGGISDDSYLDELRIYTILPDSSQQMILFDYEDLWWEEDLKNDLAIYSLKAGDVLVVPGRPRLYWENYLTLGLSIVGVLLSLTTLIITANN
jgi:hypothetical protein